MCVEMSSGLNEHELVGLRATLVFARAPHTAISGPSSRKPVMPHTLVSSHAQMGGSYVCRWLQSQVKACALHMSGSIRFALVSDSITAK